MNEKLKKILSILLTLLTVFMMATACSNEKPELTTEEEVTTALPTDTGEKYDENGYLKDSLDTKDFGGAVVNISGWSELQKSRSIPEFDVSTAEMSKDTLYSAVYLRNLSTEKRLNVNLEFSLTTGWTGKGDGSGMEQVERVRSLAGTQDLHMVATYSWNPATLMMEGLLADLTEMPHLNLLSPWWNQSVVDKCSIYDHVYYATGDIAPSFLSQIVAVFFNKTFAADEGLGNIYDYFNEDRWTLSEMMSLSKRVGYDLNDNGTKDAGDKFGLVLNELYVDAFYQGSGMLTIENAADGSLLVSEDFSNEKTQTLLSRLVGFFGRTDALCTTTGNLVYQAWVSGKTLFIVESIDDIKTGIQKGIDNFGLLPMPKYDSEQTDYCTTTGFYYTIYGVAKAAARNEVIGATLECLASEAYRRVTPVYYEKTVKTQYSSTENEYEMFEYLRQHTVIDSGRVFSKELSSHTWLDFRKCIRSGSTDWVSVYRGFEESVEKHIADLNRIVIVLAGD